MVDPRWDMFVVLFFITSGITAAVVLDKFLILLYTLFLSIFRFMANIDHERNLDFSNTFTNMTL